MSLGLALCLARTIYRIAALRAWAQHPKRVELPDIGGTWGEIFQLLIDRQRRNRRRRQRLVAALEQFQASTAALPDGAAVLAERGELVWFNAAAQLLLGLRSPQDRGQRLPNLLRHPEFSAYFAEGRFDGEVEIPSPVNAATTVALRIVPYGQNQRLLLVRDVSELRRLDRVRRDFVANASHELRTPLTVLRGYLDMMQAETAGAGDLSAWKQPLGEMHAQATRMEALIRDLLKLARLESDAGGTRQELLEVPRMLERAVLDAKNLSRDQHRLEAEVDPRLFLYGRETELESVFSNLLANAVQYTPAGGTIRLRWWRDDQGAHLTVRDTGIGIAVDDIPRLTERFYRVDEGRSRAAGGTGLGLSIVKHALERHEARLEIQSRPGHGSTFACHFPVHRVAHRGAWAVTA